MLKYDKNPFTQTESIEYIMGACGSLFDIDVINVFLKYLVVYPIGTTVNLSNGKTARVIKNRSRAITRPVVITEDKIVIDLAEDSAYLSVTIISSDTPT